MAPRPPVSHSDVAMRKALTHTVIKVACTFLVVAIVFVFSVRHECRRPISEYIQRSNEWPADTLSEEWGRFAAVCSSGASKIGILRSESAVWSQTHGRYPIFASYGLDGELTYVSTRAGDYIDYRHSICRGRIDYGRNPAQMPSFGFEKSCSALEVPP